MFLPEYTITNKILKSIAGIEYAKALAENTPILPTLEEEVQKESTLCTVQTVSHEMSKEFSATQIKMALDGLAQTIPQDLIDVVKAVVSLYHTSEEYSVGALKLVFQNLTGVTDTGKISYRSQKIPGFVNPEEILASSVELMDWCLSVDALETHPIIFAGIVRARLEVIGAFEILNPTVSNLFTRMTLRWRGYGLKDFWTYEERYGADKSAYQRAIYSIFKDQGDYTFWLEYFSEILSFDAMNVKEKVILGERQTKTAVASGLTDLTPRQDKLIRYLHNYGTLINKDFAAIFPSISEDSVLRDLKTLIDKGVVIKVGSTKSSKYKLKS